MRLASLILVLGVLVPGVLAGCAAAPETGPAPALDPPPLRGDPPLSREEVLALVRKAAEPEDAIRELDDRRLGFALDPSAIEWFRVHDAPDEVLDYLKKRAQVPWERLRGDVDPLRPAPQYVDPRRGDEDFAGRDQRELFSSLRSLSPFTTEKRAPAEDGDFGGSK